MTDLNDTLGVLMREEVAPLDPPTLDLVARGLRRGKVLRRRRTVLTSLSGAAAVLATVAAIFGGTQLLAQDTTGKVDPATTPTVHRPVGTLATLQALLPAGLRATRSSSSSLLLDDGKGASLLTVELTTAVPNTNCKGTQPNTCTVLSDGTVYVAYSQPVFAYEPHPYGVRETTVELFYPDGRQISLSNYNAPQDDGVEHTRPQPILSIDQLTQIARSKLWVYPPRVS